MRIDKMIRSKHISFIDYIILLRPDKILNRLYTYQVY